MRETADTIDSGRFRFGLFEFDTACHELRREGTLIRLQMQPAQVLSCLVLQSGAVVSREDLCKAIWGTETHVDFERGLNFCIAQIRSALGDDSTTPRYIRTIPKRGYQFIAPVERLPVVADEPKASRRPTAIRATLATALSAALLVLVGLYAGFRLRKRSMSPPIIAVVRFDNETGDPGLNRFTDGLTDNLIEQLTVQSRERYAVIGNAHILRLPRDQRDLTAISDSLHASYVILGQVQSDGAQTRILAHLIRLPDQTHLWVARMDRSISNPLSAELETTQEIAAAFAPRVAQDSSGNPLPPLPSK